MVNASRERLNTDDTPIISTIIREETVETYSIPGQYSSICSSTNDLESGIPADTVNEKGAPSPPSPVGSESWQCSGSASLILRVESMLQDGVSLQTILKTVCPSVREPSGGWSDDMITSILSELLDQPPRRDKLPQYNTFEDAIELFRSKKRILILTGAGVSVSCGIPDFRSKNGIYARLHVDFPDLPDPTAMFDIRYFRHNPAPFYNFASEIFPGQFEPSISHRFIYELEKSNQLLRNYTQNIDTLENQTGITRLIECHGSFKNATCLDCGAKFEGDSIREDVMAKCIAHCPTCKEGVIKPDIVFFGEDLAQEFHRQMSIDKDSVDLLVVVGSSLKVRPVSLIPFSVAPDVPQILINRESLPGYTADIELLGDCDEIIKDICIALGGPFSSMIESYYHKTLNISENPDSISNMPTLIRRSCLSQQEFNTLMEKMDSESKKKVEEQNCDEDGPVAKKQRLEDMYERRYISVPEVLPAQSYFQLSPNRAVFPGAEIFYDLEFRVISRPSMVYRSDISDVTDDDESDDEYDPFNGEGRGGSEPPSINDLEIAPLSRPTSCEPIIDVETTLTSFEFRRALEELNEDSI